MDIGVFIPIGNNGWLISTTSPQYMPSFELNRTVVQKAEHYGLDFALSMIKLRGFGGNSEFWDHNLESFTLMAGLAAVTRRIRLYATVADADHPAGDRRAHDDHHRFISPGRFGINLDHRLGQGRIRPDGPVAGRRAFRAPLRDTAPSMSRSCASFGTEGHSDFKGEFFPMNDCRLSPRPSGQCRWSAPGRARGHGVRRRLWRLQFRRGAGLNTPTAYAATNER